MVKSILTLVFPVSLIFTFNIMFSETNKTYFDNYIKSNQFLSDQSNYVKGQELSDNYTLEQRTNLFIKYKKRYAIVTSVVNFIVPGFGNFGWGSAIQGDSFGSSLSFYTTIGGLLIFGGGNLAFWGYRRIVNEKTYPGDIDHSTISAINWISVIGIISTLSASYAFSIIRPFYFENEYNNKLTKFLKLDQGLKVSYFNSYNLDSDNESINISVVSLMY